MDKWTTSAVFERGIRTVEELAGGEFQDNGEAWTVTKKAAIITIRKGGI